MSDSADALTTLRAAIAPKPGMRRIPLAFESYEHASLPLSQKQALNLYAEQLPSDARSPAALLRTPGLTLAASIGEGPIYAINSQSATGTYIVSGQHAFRCVYTNGQFVATYIGAVGYITDTTQADYNHMITIAVGPTAAVICVPPKAFTCTPTGALNEIGGDFPGAKSVTYLDGYFIFAQMGFDSQWFSSKLLDPTQYDALDFAFADRTPNILHRVVEHLGQLWLMGESGIEIWYDAGAADFPFRQLSGGIIETGVATPRSIVVADNTIFWVGMNSIVFRSAGIRSERVSTHAIETIIGTLNPSLCTALTYTQGGHVFVAFSWPTRTFVFDCATKLWHERSSSVDGTGNWRPSCGGLLGSQPILGDSLSPSIMIPDQTSALELAIAVKRSVILPPIWAATNRAFMNRLEIEMEVGTSFAPGSLLLEWSDDGGYSWPGQRTLNTGALSAYRTRVVANRLGSFRQRMLRISATGPMTIYAVDADISPGDGG